MSSENHIADILEKMKAYMLKSSVGGQLSRDAHPKTLGVLKATFKINKDILDKARVGLFSEANEYKAVVRFSNGSHKIQSDKKADVRGIAFKVFGVPESMSTEDSLEKGNHDLLLMSSPILPFGTLKSFRDVIHSTVDGSFLGVAKWMLFNLKTLRKVLQVRGRHNDLSQTEYWSAAPFRLGDSVVKYKLTPAVRSNHKFNASRNDNFLRENLKSCVENKDIVFDFCVQFFDNENETPVNDVSVEWNEDKFPFVKIGQLIIPKQELIDDNQLSKVLRFNIINSVKAHQAVGELNNARKVVYKALSDFRNQASSEYSENYLKDLDEIYSLLGKSL